MSAIAYIAVGLFAGICGGMFGIGGGSIVIPALVYLFSFSQHQAQGTSLMMMIPPIGLLAALRYYYSGNVKLAVAAWLCLGFFVGGLLGAMAVQHVSDPLLKKGFGIFLLLVAMKMIFGR